MEIVLCAVVHTDVGSAEPLAVEEQDKELPALSREVDAGTAGVGGPATARHRGREVAEATNAGGGGAAGVRVTRG